MKNRIALLGATAVALGALGAHSLKSVLEPSSLESYKVAVLYHLIHTLALLALVSTDYKRVTANLWTAGILLFSGSIYALALDELLGTSLSFLGPITPVGGLFFVAGWLSLFSRTSHEADN